MQPVIVRSRYGADGVYTIDLTFGDQAATWKETEHPRGQGGKFARTAQKGAAAVKGAARKVTGLAQKGTRAAVSGLTEEDYHVLRQGLHKAGSAPRKNLAQKLGHIAKALPRLLMAHLRHERQHAIGAVGALKSLARGKRPEAHQLKSLRHFMMTIMMSAASMALTGDVTGSVGHLAGALGQEVLNHTLLEHTAKAGAGAARLALGGADAAAIEGLSPQDLALLQRFVERLAHHMEHLDIPDEKARELLRRQPKVTVHQGDAGWKETEHPRGGDPKHPGRFSEKGGAGKEGGETPSKEAKAPEKEKSSGRPAEPTPERPRLVRTDLAAEPEPYARRSLSGGTQRRVRSDGLSAAVEHKPSDHFKETLARIGADAPDIHELAPGQGEGFAAMMRVSLEGNPHAAAVHIYDPAEYEGMRTFATPDGKAGFALKGDDIVSVFKAKGGPKNAVASMLALAVKQGGRRLDGFDPMLPELYGNAGFKAVARLPFDPKEAPEGWDFERQDSPDVVGMIYDPNHAENYEPTDGERVEEYDDIAAAQRAALATTGLAGSKGHHALISTRRPTAVGAPPEGDYYKRADIEAMKAAPKDFFHKAMDLLRNPEAYPNFKKGELDGKTDDEIARIAIDHAVKNLMFLYDNVDPEVREQGPLWYEGAHNMAEKQADKYGLPVQSTAGVYAALSPQKNWDENVYLADAVIDIMKNKQDHTWDDKMTDRGDEIWGPKNPEEPTKAELENQAAFRRISQPPKKLSQLTDPVDKAIWVRTYDETYSDRSFQNLSPDGTPLGTAMAFDPEDKEKDPAKRRKIPARAAWQGLDAISGAIEALESDGDRDVISQAMGDMHKVRSFYNNILDPSSDNDDVTMDTHAVGAALLAPMSSKAQAVNHNLHTNPSGADLIEAKKHGWKGSPQSSITGLKGTYGLWADAYREATRQINQQRAARGEPPIKPRVLQSVTWEAKRRLMPDTMPGKKKDEMNAAWRTYHTGGASLEDTQHAILDIARRSDRGEEPSGDDIGRRSPRALDARQWPGTYPRELYRGQLGLDPARPVGRRGGSAAARRIAGRIYHFVWG